MEPAKGFEPMKLTRRITSAFLLTTQVNRHMVENKGFEPFWFPLCKRGKHPKHFHSPYGGSNGSRTHLYTVTVYYTNRYTMKPNNLYVFILYYSTPAIFLCGHSVHTGRFYSCFDFTGSSLRAKLSNYCFGSYSDIQLVCIDIKIIILIKCHKIKHTL